LQAKRQKARVQANRVCISKLIFAPAGAEAISHQWLARAIQNNYTTEKADRTEQKLQRLLQA
jgi:hypothetical protein